MVTLCNLYSSKMLPHKDNHTAACDQVILMIYSGKLNKISMYKGPLLISSDHGGYGLKKRLVRFVQNQLNLKITDMGPHKYDEEDDYPDFAFPLAEKVVKEDGRGILICKNGIGVCVAANKVKEARAGIGYNLMAAETMMTDDNTNILCLASKLTSEEHSMAIVKRWLQSEFSHEPRHERRIAKIEEFENEI